MKKQSPFKILRNQEYSPCTTLFKGKVCRGHNNIKPSSAKKLVGSKLRKDYEVNNNDILFLV